MAIEPQILKSIHYFSDLAIPELDSIKQFFSQKEVAQGEVFIVERQWSDVLYFLVSGVVKIFKTSYHGKEQIMGIAHSGDALNAVSTFDGGPNYASGLAMTPILLYVIHKKDLMAILQQYPAVALKAVCSVAIRVRQAWTLVEDLSFSQVTGRLAKMLLKREEEKGDWPRLTQQDMAAMIGTTRVVVNRSLRIMEDKGAIRLERRGIVITDKQALQKMAENL